MDIKQVYTITQGIPSTCRIMKRTATLKTGLVNLNLNMGKVSDTYIHTHSYSFIYTHTQLYC